MKKKVSTVKSPIKQLEFNEVVDLVAGDALLRLVKGENWRHIIWNVCMAVAQWQESR